MRGYTEADEAFIRANYITMPYPILAHFLGKKTTAIGEKVKRMRLPSKLAATKPARTRKSYRCYVTWRCMIRRCTNPKCEFWHAYGGRGIKVCERWLLSFDAFLSDMGERKPTESIDRINPDGDYEPSNCRWIPKSEQGKTTRRYLNAKPCFVCNERRTSCGGRCARCAEYYRKRGIERPKDLGAEKAHRWIHSNASSARKMGWLK